MNLYEDNQLDEEKRKSKKLMKIIIIIIAIMFVLSLGIIGYIFYLQNAELKVYIDGNLTNVQKDIFVIEENNIYVSIKDIANYIGYTPNNAEYKDKYSEDTTKCYLDNNQETVSYILDSNEIYKTIIKGKSNEEIEYEYFTIDEPVKLINNKLYTTEQGIKIGCNLSFSYKKSNNTIEIYTLPYLVSYYTNRIEEANFTDYFANQKTLLYDRIVVKNELGQYGVDNLKNETIIGKKYKTILFSESTQEFIVTTSEGKVGIINIDAVTVIEPQYDTIKKIDEQGLYMVSNNGKYGVIDNQGNIVIHLEYDNIGIDQTKFKADSINNQYVIYNKCIPVSKSGKWGILDKNGNTVLPINYDSFGCVANTSKNPSANNLILIPEYEAFVVNENKLYGLFNSEGTRLIPTLVTDMYSITSQGEKKYYLTYEGQTMDIIDYLSNTLKIAPVQ